MWLFEGKWKNPMQNFMFISHAQTLTWGEREKEKGPYNEQRKKGFKILKQKIK